MMSSTTTVVVIAIALTVEISHAVPVNTTREACQSTVYNVQTVQNLHQVQNCLIK